MMKEYTRHTKKWYHACMGDCRGYQFDCLRYSQSNPAEIMSDCKWYIAFNRTIESLLVGEEPKTLQEVYDDIETEIEQARQDRTYDKSSPTKTPSDGLDRWLKNSGGK